MLVGGVVIGDGVALVIMLVWTVADGIDVPECGRVTTCRKQSSDAQCRSRWNVRRTSRVTLSVGGLGRRVLSCLAPVRSRVEARDQFS